MEVITRHGNALYCLRIFQDYLDKLTTEVEKLEEADPFNVHHHPKTKLFYAIYKNISDTVPKEPSHKNYLLGKTLGKDYTHWRRVKKQGLLPRYRLFFQFNSQPPKSIVYGWVNDDSTLRKQGSKTDVYEVFKKMLKNGAVPNSWEELKKASNRLEIK